MSTTDSQEELLTQTDSANNVIGPLGRKIAHNSGGKYYRTIYVLVFNKQGEMLLQKRSPTKDLYPNCWDISVGGHVNFGDTYEDTAVRELKEELGIKANIEELEYLKEVLVKLPNSNEFFHVYKYTLKNSDTLKLESKEVSDIKWQPLLNVMESIKQNHDQWYTRPTQVLTSIYSSILGKD